MKFSISSVLATATALLSSASVVSAAATSTASASSSSSSSSSSVPEIVIKGNKFFYSNNGTQFFFKGIAYQQELANATSDTTFTDPLADGTACARDLPYLLELKTNVLRVYAVNTSLNHDDCINLFAENGIYIIADLSEPGLSINRDSPSWTIDLYSRYTSVIDQLQGYSNVLGFFAGNEVTNNNTNTDASPFVKAAIRDTKAYIKSQGYRSIPVGYSTNDDADTRGYLADYFNCGSEDEIADFYGINMYEWCGSTVNFETSGYADRTLEFENYTVPVFFSEYGCNVPQPRQFNDIPSLYSTNMTDTWSGGIVYMYFEESNNYGLVSIVNSKVSTLSDFNALSTKINAVSPSASNSASFTPTNTAQRDCPASTLADWKAASDLPPTPNQTVCDCMANSLECVVVDSVDETDYADLFSYVCNQIDCGGITSNGTTGDYGSYSFCSAKEKLSFVLNLYYISQKKSASACDFSAKATTASTQSAGSVCASIVSAAGSSGLNSISVTVTATGSSSGSSATGSSSSSKSGSSSSSSASASATSKSPAPANLPATVNVFGVQTAAALFAAFSIGLALVL
ncbi:uncharacterized protein SAPINGB_P001418 [Magnusiomyces paraingens]|uniref:1,3-beta-glucanosyltransferase n=1 Tax=Magnusiomyces paraingens TaxID=2606893 RepID=A0A5E8B651_9ASCO|nr:uncharacterized protein SAPINGB_P001418 [Saprochaete ingens]VVT46849.1 unnamed protein product [Saprochaete ingens]